MLFGIGTALESSNVLTNRLEKRGLEKGHTKYDPHNQYITTVYKTGVLGLLMLLLICFYTLLNAIKTKNKLAFYTIIMFIVAMMAESLLQRVVGIYFFTCILLLLSSLKFSSNNYFENSNFRYPRNSK